MLPTHDATLLPGQRATLDLWTESHCALPHHPAGRPLAEAAAQAVLVTLRDCPTPDALFRYYHDRDGTAADCDRIASLTAPATGASPADGWRQADHAVRDAAFHLRWRELCRGGE